MSPSPTRIVVLCDNGMRAVGGVHPAVIEVLEGPRDLNRWLVLDDVFAERPDCKSTVVDELRVSMAHVVSWRMAIAVKPSDAA